METQLSIKVNIYLVLDITAAASYNVALMTTRAVTAGDKIRNCLFVGVSET